MAYPLGTSRFMGQSSPRMSPRTTAVPYGYGSAPIQTMGTVGSAAPIRTMGAVGSAPLRTMGTYGSAAPIQTMGTVGTAAPYRTLGATAAPSRLYAGASAAPMGASVPLGAYIGAGTRRSTPYLGTYDASAAIVRPTPYLGTQTGVFRSPSFVSGSPTTIAPASSIVMSQPATYLTQPAGTYISQPVTVISEPAVAEPVVLAAPANEEVLRIVAYKWQAGKEAEGSALMEQILSTILPQIEGLISINFGETGAVCGGSMTFASQAHLDQYTATLKQEALGLMMPLLDGPPVLDHTGLLRQRINQQDPAQDQQVVRVCAYQCKEGVEAEFAAVFDELVDTCRAGAIQGCISLESANVDSQTYIISMVMQNQSFLDAYKAVVREQFLAKMMPFLAGGPLFDETFNVTAQLLGGMPM